MAPKKGALSSRMREGSGSGSDSTPERNENTTPFNKSNPSPHERLFRKCKPVRDTLARNYLNALGVTTPITTRIRGWNALPHKPSGTTAPSLVAQINGANGAAIGIIRLYLSPDGNFPSSLNPNRMYLGAAKGGAVWIGEPDDKVVVGVDVGDCLIASQATELPTWAVIDENGMRNVVLPAQIKEAIIFRRPDDPAGMQSAMRQAAHSWKKAGVRVRIASVPLALHNVALRNLAPSEWIKERDDQFRAFIDSAPDFTGTIGAFPDRGTEACATSPTSEATDNGAGDTDEDKDEDPSALMVIVKSLELFHDASGKAYALVPTGAQKECFSIRGKSFSQWLKKAHYAATKKIAKFEIDSVIELLEAQAIYDGPERQVFLRVAELAGRIYVDLSNDAGEVVEIDGDGWRIITAPPVIFRRTNTMSGLPRPVAGGKIDDLRRFINLESESDFVLLIGAMLAYFRSVGPYPVLALIGPQGTAKSTTSRLVKSLLDPNTSPLRALPSDLQNLAIAANNAHILAYDNVSHLSPRMSDAICRLATGAGYSTRALYSDDTEVVFDAQRPVMLNGIGGFITRQDLAERTLAIRLKLIPATARRTQRELLADYNAAAPKILGALLDATSHGLKSSSKVHLEKLPRMADFAEWVCACEAALFESGTFLRAYDSHFDLIVRDVLEGDLVASAIQKMAERTVRPERTIWEGTAQQLLKQLNGLVDQDQQRNRDWPDTPRALRSALERCQAFLLMAGIAMELGHREGHERNRMIFISFAPEEEK